VSYPYARFASPPTRGRPAPPRGGGGAGPPRRYTRLQPLIPHARIQEPTIRIWHGAAFPAGLSLDGRSHLRLAIISEEIRAAATAEHRPSKPADPNAASSVWSCYSGARATGSPSEAAFD